MKSVNLIILMPTLAGRIAAAMGGEVDSIDRYARCNGE
jgi:hypothetical protein